MDSKVKDLTERCFDMKYFMSETEEQIAIIDLGILSLRDLDMTEHLVKEAARLKKEFRDFEFGAEKITKILFGDDSGFKGVSQWRDGIRDLSDEYLAKFHRLERDFCRAFLETQIEVGRLLRSVEAAVKFLRKLKTASGKIQDCLNVLQKYKNQASFIKADAETMAMELEGLQESFSGIPLVKLTLYDLETVITGNISNFSNKFDEIHYGMSRIVAKTEFLKKTDIIPYITSMFTDILVKLEETSFSKDQERLRENVCDNLELLKEVRRNIAILAPLYMNDRLDKVGRMKLRYLVKELESLKVRGHKFDLEECFLVNIEVLEDLNFFVNGALSKVEQIGYPFPGWEAVASWLDSELKMPKDSDRKISEMMNDLFVFDSKIKDELEELEFFSMAIVSSQQLLEEAKKMDSIPEEIWEWVVILRSQVDHISSGFDGLLAGWNSGEIETLMAGNLRKEVEKFRLVNYGMMPILAHTILALVYTRFPDLNTDNMLIAGQIKDMLSCMQFVIWICYYGCTRSSSCYVEKISRIVYNKSCRGLYKLMDVKMKVEKCDIR